ncbi:MAG TPA: response regulator [Mucilaginibacter sp.]|nr:response regulator [Mucilaginibacter sp.]
MKKLLIIEDDEDNLDMLGLFAKSLNLEVVLKKSPPSIQEIQFIDPHLILLDHWLGSELGGQFCLEVKNNELTQDIPIIMMSAVPNVGQIASDAYADGSINKPFELDDLEAIIQSYLG